MDYAKNIQSLMDEFYDQTTPIEYSDWRSLSARVEVKLYGGRHLATLSMRKRFAELAHGEVALDWITGLADKHQVQLYTHATLPRTDNSIGRIEFIDLAVEHGFREEGDYDLIYTPAEPLGVAKLG